MADSNIFITVLVPFITIYAKLVIAVFTVKKRKRAMSGGVHL
jgi:hypothetical protein